MIAFEFIGLVSRASHFGRYVHAVGSSTVCFFGAGSGHFYFEESIRGLRSCWWWKKDGFPRHEVDCSYIGRLDVSGGRTLAGATSVLAWWIFRVIYLVAQEPARERGHS